MKHDPDKLVVRGRDHLARGRYHKALDAFRDATHAAPHNSEAWLSRAEAAAQVGALNEAVDALFRVVDAYTRSGRASEALTLCLRILELDPEHQAGLRFRRLLERRTASAEPSPAPPAPARLPTPSRSAGHPAPASGPAGAAGKRRPTPPPLPSRPPRVTPASGAVVIPRPPAAPPRADGVDVLRAVIDVMASSPLLSELDSDLVKRLVEVGRPVSREAGADVFHQDEPGDSLYLVLRGQVAVVKHGPRGGTELARLGPGSFFGEIAVITDQPRTATVRATTNSVVLEVSRAAVSELVALEPRMLELLMRFFRARLVATLLATSPIFAGLDLDEQRQLVAAMSLRELEPGSEVLSEGQPTQGLFVLLAGELDVVLGERALATLAAGDVFGEMSLLDQAACMASVRASHRAWVVQLPPAGYHALVDRHPAVRARLATLARARHAANLRSLG